MSIKFSKWDYFRSYLFPKVIDRQQSALNPYLEVSLTRGRLMLNTAGANYSFGGLHTVFQVAFRKIDFDKYSVKNMLLLGLGAGSVPSIIYDELKMNIAITAIENDVVVIDIGKKYFNTSQFEKLNIVCADAYEYLQNSNEMFDVIVIDIYEDIKVPEKFETKDFLQMVHDHLNAGGMMIFNKVAATQKLYWQYRAIKEMTCEIFISVESIRVLGFNRVIVAIK
jgi:spermidine synthase